MSNDAPFKFGDIVQFVSGRKRWQVRYLVRMPDSGAYWVHLRSIEAGRPTSVPATRLRKIG